jgi:carbon monoxide dehydrogenase subunit G
MVAQPIWNIVVFVSRRLMFASPYGRDLDNDRQDRTKIGRSIGHPSPHVDSCYRKPIRTLAGRASGGLRVEFDNSFEVPLRPEEAWPLLMDIRRIAPCMPGAELTEVVDDITYKGRIAVRLGPVALAFAGTVRFEELDNLNYRARVKAQGSDAKGRGGANVAASFKLEPAGSGSKVLVHTDLALSGAVAQYGRGAGIIQATAAQLMAQFANNLKAQIAQREPAPAVAQTAPPQTPSAQNVTAPRPARPISGFALLAKVIWKAVVRLFTGRAQS